MRALTTELPPLKHYRVNGVAEKQLGFPFFAYSTTEGARLDNGAIVIVGGLTVEPGLFSGYNPTAGTT